MVERFPTRRVCLVAPLALCWWPEPGRATPGETVLRWPPSGQPLRVFALDDPRRIVLDLPLPWPGPGALPRSALVAGVRHGLARPGVARVILDLAAPAEAQVEAGAGALTIRLAPISAEAFAARSGWPDDARAAAPRPPRPLIMIDPGHGGRDPGAVVAGLREKDITLAVSLALAPVLEARGFRVASTRRDDRFVSLAERVALAQRAGATALLSLHADTVTEGDAAGASVYLLAAEASDSQTAGLAERENATGSAGVGHIPGEGRDVGAVLAALASRETQRQAAALGPALVAALSARVPVLSGNPLRAAAFRVLKAPDVPSALIELGFLSNAQDRGRLMDPVWRAAVVAALADGVADWYGDREGVACASQPCHRRD